MTKKVDAWSRKFVFTGPEKLYRYKQRLGEPTTRASETARLRYNPAYQLHRPARKRFPRRKVVVSGPNEMVDVDLLDLVDIKGQNYKQRYLLTIIDVFSKKAYAHSLSSKHATKTAAAFKKVLDSNDGILVPRSIRTDHGKEFKGEFDKFLTDRGIKHILTSSPEIKANFVERFHRTFRDKLQKYLTFSNNSNWTKVYQHLIDSYNNTPHLSLKNLAPNDVNENNTAELFDAMYGAYFLNALENKFALLSKKRRNKFTKGERVRVSIFKKSPFIKASQQTFTNEIFTIDEVLDTYPETYKLTDSKGEKIIGSYYSYELQKANKQTG